MDQLPRATRFALIGPGRVGTALAVLLQRAGHRITGCAGRRSASLERAVSRLGCPSSTKLSEAISGADALAICVPDDVLPGLAGALAAHVTPGLVAFHTAGAYGRAPLAPLDAAGVQTLAVHPLQSIPDVDTGIERIPGSFFGVTCQEETRGWAADLVGAAGGSVFWVEESDRTAYHAAAVIVSNFLVTLAGTSQSLVGSADPYLPLMRGTVENIASLGPSGALTGPLVRGDAETVRRHLDVLDSTDAGIAAMYRVLAIETLKRAQESGRIEELPARRLRQELDR